MSAAVDMSRRDLRTDAGVVADLSKRLADIAADIPSMVFVVLGELARLETENTALKAEIEQLKKV